MGGRKSASTAGRRSVAKKTGAKRAAKKTASKRKPVRKATSRPTLASVSAQLLVLTEQLETLTKLVRTLATTHVGPRAALEPTGGQPVSLVRDESDADTDPSGEATGSPGTLDHAAFDAELLAILAQLDRRGLHAGMVPIPDVREAFLRRGWTRRTFDDRLLQAERDFVVDLKTANDPARLAEPELAIEEPGRGYLQYVVLR